MIVGRWRLSGRFARRVELDGVGGSAVGPRRLRRRHGSDMKIGWHVGLEIVDGR
jgi:hypothetical protein